MKPVDQVVFDEGKGDCFAACLATLLEIPLADVPNFNAGPGDMYEHARAWLAGRGLLLRELHFPDHFTLESVSFDPPRLAILGGYGPRKNAQGGRKGHGVVVRAGRGGVELVHDPHPSRAGLIAEGWRLLWFLERGPEPLS